MPDVSVPTRDDLQTQTDLALAGYRQQLAAMTPGARGFFDLMTGGIADGLRREFPGARLGRPLAAFTACLQTAADEMERTGVPASAALILTIAAMTAAELDKTEAVDD